MIYCGACKTGKAQIADIEAPAQVNIDNGELVVNCAPSGNDFNFISRLEIKRKQVSESSYTTILYVEDPPRGSDPVFRDSKWLSISNGNYCKRRKFSVYDILVVKFGENNFTYLAPPSPTSLRSIHSLKSEYRPQIYTLFFIWFELRNELSNFENLGDGGACIYIYI